MSRVKPGIYDKAGWYSVKVVGKVKGWGKSTVMYFTNNPNYGKSYFGMEGRHRDNFLKGYKRR